MIIATTDEIPGREVIEVFGLVRGNTIRARHLGRDILAKMRGIVGGEVSEYTKLMGECREQALDRMIEEAESMGANAIVGVRFMSTEVMTEAAEILVYGTAVRVKE